MEFEEFTSAPSKLEILDTNKAYLTIHEGKFHQVKRMFEKANCTVTYLQRIEFGPLKLDDLPLGEFRALTQEELDAFKKGLRRPEISQVFSFRHTKNRPFGRFLKILHMPLIL